MSTSPWVPLLHSKQASELYTAPPLKSRDILFKAANDLVDITRAYQS